MIDEFFILRRDGLSLFHTMLEESSYTVNMDQDLFAGFSSAIVTFTSELGAGHLSKIEIEDQIFVFEVMENIITIAKISEDDDEKTAEHVVALLYREFASMYYTELKNFNGTVRRDIFFPFTEKVREIVSKCEKVAKKNPHLLINIPPSINIDAILELSEYSDEIIDNFPEATIKLIRKFQNSLPVNVMHYTMYKLGREVGKEIAKKKLRKINDKAIMKLLDEISVSSIENNIITLKICPVCRGVEKEEHYCDFMSGFIEGAYNDPSIAVREITCHAVGDKNCSFRVFKDIK